jgi:hypothetical protein
MMKKLPSLARAIPAGMSRWAGRGEKPLPVGPYDRKPKSPTGIGIILLVTVMLILGVFSGMLLGAGQKMLLAPIIGGAAGVILLMLPLEWMLILLLGVSFIAVGMLTFFANINAITWLPYTLAGFLYLYFLIKLIELRNAGHATLTMMFLWLGIFLLLAAATSVYEGIPAMQWLAVGKNYFAFWSVLLVMAFLPLREKSIEQLWKLLILVSFIQLPIALYQYVVVGGHRVETGAGDAWDVVVGTFGGSQEGGGQSAALGYFQVVMVVFVLSLWRRSLISKTLLLLVIAVAVLTIFLAEVKAMLVVMPAAFLILYRRDLMRRPREMVVGLLLLVGFVAAMPVAYNVLHYERQGRDAMTTSQFMEGIVNQADPHLVNASSGQMGRLTQLEFWSAQNASRTYEYLFGYGIGATQFSRLFIGDVAMRYFPQRPANTSASVLLWEVGLLGLMFYVAVLLAGGWLAARLASNAQIPVFHRAILEASAIGLVLAVLTLPYKQFAVQVSPIQMLIVLMLGQAAYWHTRVRASEARRGASLLNREDQGGA